MVRFGPIGIVVEIERALGAFARVDQNSPLHVSHFADGLGDGFGLKGVIVAASAGDEEGADRFLLREGCESEEKCKCAKKELHMEDGTLAAGGHSFKRRKVRERTRREEPQGRW
jgi:hypothetical protein